MKTLIILEDGQELIRKDGTFLAAYPSLTGTGISITIEGDFSPLAKTIQPFLQQLLGMLMSHNPLR